ncbi:odorant receptor 30a [Teleopsis dalmanni]|uniref:odorant receptor 30a n=1 Tax=Teleopsis dalmanni TaxID=139649 RepID=UPI0018CFA3D7|nr:odorant receptor 30a [Teleopsis dalmanni]
MFLIESIEDVPILSTTLRIMKFWSFLIVHNWRRYVCLTPYILMNITQFLDLYYTTEPIVNVIRNAYITVLCFNTILRALLLCLHRYRYEQFMAKLKNYYVQLMCMNDTFVNSEIKNTIQAAKVFTRINLLMGILACIGFVTYPIFSTSKVLPFGVFVPGINKYRSPYYEIIFILQVIMVPMGCCMNIPYTNLIISFIMFGILMCKTLQYKIRNLNFINSSKAKDDLVWCIKYQVKIIRFVDTVNGLTTYIWLTEFLTYGAMLCVMLFLLLIVQTVGQMIIVSAYIITFAAQIIPMYFFANELYVESIAVATAAYESNWYDSDMDTKKFLKLFMLRAQKPCAILVGNVAHMNLELLQTLLNTTYSYFTLLKRFYG